MRSLRTVPSRGGSNPTGPVGTSARQVAGTNEASVRKNERRNEELDVQEVAPSDALSTTLLLPSSATKRVRHNTQRTQAERSQGKPKLLSSSSLRAAKAPRHSESTRPPPTCASAASEPSELPTQVTCQRMRATCRQATCLQTSELPTHTMSKARTSTYIRANITCKGTKLSHASDHITAEIRPVAR